MKVKELLQNLRDCDSDMEVNIIYNGKIYRYIELYADDEAVYIEGYTSASNTTSKYTQQRKQSYSQTFYTVNDLIADLNECDTNATVVLAIYGALSSQIDLYADADYLYIEGYSSSIKSSKGENSMNIKHNRRGIKADFRDNTIDKDAVRELVLVITNDGDQYRRQITPAIENLKKKYKKGTYDRDLAVKLWQYVADEGVRRYNKEYGSGTYSVAWLNPATRKAIAEELRDYYEDEIMYEEPVNASTRRRPIKAAEANTDTYRKDMEQIQYYAQKVWQDIQGAAKVFLDAREQFAPIEVPEVYGDDIFYEWYYRDYIDNFDAVHPKDADIDVSYPYRNPAINVRYGYFDSKDLYNYGDDEEALCEFVQSFSAMEDLYFVTSEYGHTIADLANDPYAVFDDVYGDDEAEKVNAAYEVRIEFDLWTQSDQMYDMTSDAQKFVDLYNEVAEYFSYGTAERLLEEYNASAEEY